MSFLAQFLLGFFGSIFSFFVQTVTKRAAFGLAVSATLLVVTVSFYTAIKLLLNGIFVAVSNEWFLMVFFSILPSNFSTCLTVMLSADVAGFLYRHQLMTIKAVSGIN